MAVNYILRLDDVAPNMNWANFDLLTTVVERLGVCPLAAVVPDNRDPFLLDYPTAPGDFWDRIAELSGRGWKVAMHGYQHLTHTESGGVLGLSDRSEFAGLPYGEQLEKIRRGRDLLAGRGIHTDTFVAPWHSYDRNTERALLSCGIDVMSDGFALYPYRENGITHVPQLFAASTRPPLPVGLWTICMHLNTISRGGLLRVLGFVERERSRFIHFDDALDMGTSLTANRLAGALARGIGVSAAVLTGHGRRT